MKRFKIVNGGHVNLPDELAKRWRTRFVTLEDHGDHAVLRPTGDEGKLPDGLEEHIHTDAAESSLRRRSSGAGF
jgi:hypothetical protein